MTYFLKVAMSKRGRYVWRLVSIIQFILLSLLVYCLAGCAGKRSLPPYEKPLPRTAVQHVRTTAYTHSEADHRAYGRMTASGNRLRFGRISSAAADWSRWPLGTVFRLCDTGQLFEIDDYGWMLAGTNTIDIYQPTRAAMNRWGVRHVEIEVLQWGDIERSRQIMIPRRQHKHVARMLRQIEKRYH